MKEGAELRAILLDLDGTLVTDEGTVRPRVVEALRAATEAGVRVVVSTGRSELGAQEILDVLELPDPAIVYNGAGLWCPVKRKLLEERLLSNRAVARTLEMAEEREWLTVVMRSEHKFASTPRTPVERSALRDMEGLALVDRAELPRENVIRITVMEEGAEDSAALSRALEERIAMPVYLTDFPLSWLAHHRESSMQVIDIHPPCRGKGEAIRVCGELWGIAPGEIAAVGDATNDLPMFEGVGLSVAMANSMPETLAAADRTIGDNNSDAIAELVGELFGVAVG
jgi:Cof subfamily protein (haloacid dehalogenase superfamily)